MHYGEHLSHGKMAFVRQLLWGKGCFQCLSCLHSSKCSCGINVPCCHGDVMLTAVLGSMRRYWSSLASSQRPETHSCASSHTCWPRTFARAHTPPTAPTITHRNLNVTLVQYRRCSCNVGLEWPWGKMSIWIFWDWQTVWVWMTGWLHPCT